LLGVLCCVAEGAKDGCARGQNQDCDESTFHKLPFFPSRASAC
jgi:hypothetical protein